MAASEDPSRIEPCELESFSPELGDVVAELVKGGTELGARLHPETASSLADLVAIMNSYYSNLIEGHHTRPRDIERALANDLDTDGRRDLQLEGRSHVRVQKGIEEQYAAGKLPEPAASAFISEVHRRLYEAVPSTMLRVHGAGGRIIDMRPGEFRSRSDEDVVVGRHVPPSGANVARFMEYFEARFAMRPRGTASRIAAMAIAHHRFNFIHPFPDGNGRVSRLVSHAMGLHAGVGAHGLWSISRGLARGLRERAEYEQMMDLADAPRTSDTDGRGNLSAKALADFVL